MHPSADVVLFFWHESKSCDSERILLDSDRSPMFVAIEHCYKYATPDGVVHHFILWKQL